MFIINESRAINFYINLLLEEFFVSFHTYHCFHLTPVVRLEMWKHDWVTPWPKCHANEENKRTYCVFLQPNAASSCTTLDPSVKTVPIWYTEEALDSTYCSCLKRLESHVFFFSPACMFQILLHPAHLDSRTQRQVVLLCRLATNSTPAVVNWSWLQLHKLTCFLEWTPCLWAYTVGFVQMLILWNYSACSKLDLLQTKLFSTLDLLQVMTLFKKGWMLLCYMLSKLIHLISHVRPFYKDNLQEKKSERKLKEHTNCKNIKN